MHLELIFSYEFFTKYLTNSIKYLYQYIFQSNSLLQVQWCDNTGLILELKHRLTDNYI